MTDPHHSIISQTCSLAKFIVVGYLDYMWAPIMASCFLGWSNIGSGWAWYRVVLIIVGALLFLFSDDATVGSNGVPETTGGSVDGGVLIAILSRFFMLCHSTLASHCATSAREREATAHLDEESGRKPKNEEEGEFEENYERLSTPDTESGSVENVGPSLVERIRLEMEAEGGAVVDPVSVVRLWGSRDVAFEILILSGASFMCPAAFVMTVITGDMDMSSARSFDIVLTLGEQP